MVFTTEGVKRHDTSGPSKRFLRCEESNYFLRKNLNASLAVVALIFIIVTIFQTKMLCTTSPAPEMGLHLGCGVAKTGSLSNPSLRPATYPVLTSAQDPACTFMPMLAAMPLNR